MENWQGLIWGEIEVERQDVAVNRWCRYCGQDLLVNWVWSLSKR